MTLLPDETCGKSNIDSLLIRCCICSVVLPSQRLKQGRVAASGGTLWNSRCQGRGVWYDSTVLADHADE